MAKTNLGRVMPLPKGEYSADATYTRLDIVSYNGASYICKASAGVRGVVPTNDLYWQVIASQGAKRDPGDTTEVEKIVNDIKDEIEKLNPGSTTADAQVAANTAAIKNKADKSELSALALELKEISIVYEGTLTFGDAAENQTIEGEFENSHEYCILAESESEINLRVRYYDISDRTYPIIGVFANGENRITITTSDPTHYNRGSLMINSQGGAKTVKLTIVDRGIKSEILFNKKEIHNLKDMQKNLHSSVDRMYSHSVVSSSHSYGSQVDNWEVQYNYKKGAKYHIEVSSSTKIFALRVMYYDTVMQKFNVLAELSNENNREVIEFPINSTGASLLFNSQGGAKTVSLNISEYGEFDTEIYDNKKDIESLNNKIIGLYETKIFEGEHTYGAAAENWEITDDFEKGASYKIEVVSSTPTFALRVMYYDIAMQKYNTLTNLSDVNNKFAFDFPENSTGTALIINSREGAKTISLSIKKIGDIPTNKQKIDKLIEEIDILKIGKEYAENNSSVVNSKDEILISTESGVTGWVWTLATERIYMGSNKKVSKDCFLNYVQMYLYSDDISYDGDSAKIHIGTVDQRDWFLPRISYDANIERKQGNIYWILPNECTAFIKKDEVVFVEMISKGVATSALSVPVSGDSDFYWIKYNLNNTLNKTVKKFTEYVVSVHEYESIFGLNKDIENNEQKINLLEEQVNKPNYLIDTATGAKYKIVVTNGQLSVKSMMFNNVLMLGNSFTAHDPTKDAWFSNGRSMAASVDSTMAASMMESVTGWEITRRTDIVGWERDTHGYNYNNIRWLLSDKDAIILQVGENVPISSIDTLEEDYMTLVSYIRNNSSAEVFGMIGHVEGARAEKIKTAAQRLDLPIVDCTSVSFEGRMFLGSYVTDDDGNLHPIYNDGVTYGHPSDVGEYNIATKLLSLMGVDNTIQNRIFKIQVIGDAVLAPCDKWVSDGIVTLKKVKDVSSISIVTKSGVTVTPTLRTNNVGDFYTFTMPEEDVIITVRP